jgi:alpha-methylacyl-CoA racemase
VPGCLAVHRLKELGAQVTKVEPPDGDPLIEMSREWYGLLTQDMAILRLDLKDSKSYRLFEERLQKADLLLSSMRPVALERLRLGWKELHARFPELCHVALIGYPPPQENRPGHDLTYQAQAGLLFPPELPRTLLADLAGVEHAVSAALALLLARQRGQGADFSMVSIFEAGLTFAAPLHYGLTAQGGILGGDLPGYNLYPARSGWIAVATLEGHFQEKLLKELGLEDSQALAAAFQEKTAGEWGEWASARDLPLVEVAGLSPVQPASGESNQSL